MSVEVVVVDLLGIHVPSTAPLFLALLAAHVAAAMVAVASGAAAALTRRKGRGRHARLGTVYFAAMGGSYVAMLTAFYVDNGKQLPVWDRLPSIAYWLLPAAVGVPLIWRAIRRARHRHRWGCQRGKSAAAACQREPEPAPRRSPTHR